MRIEVASLGAHADEVTGERGTARGSVSVKVQEFAILSDGRRMVLDDQRGYTGRAHGYGGTPDPVDAWASMTREQVEEDVRNVLLPDDDEDDEEHPWAWLAGRLRELGVDVTPQRLKQLPYDVVLSERLLARLGEPDTR